MVRVEIWSLSSQSPTGFVALVKAMRRTRNLTRARNKLEQLIRSRRAKSPGGEDRTGVARVAVVALLVSLG